MSEPHVRTAGDDRAPAGGPLAVVLSLRTALDRLSGALAAPDLDGLVAAESLLGDALARASSAGPVDPADRGRLREEVDRARLVLDRCRRLGRTLHDLTRVSAAADGTAPHGYETSFGRTATGRTVDARV